MCNQPCKTTSLDVAKLAGVSRSTVSRVVNGYPNVPETTRKRVLEVIAQYGYVPSVSAKTLRGVRARCVGVFLSDGGWPETVQAELLYAFSQSAQARGYMTLSGTLEPYASPGCEQQVRNVLNSGCVDAGVFLNPMGGAALFQRLLREGQTVGILGMQPLETQERLFSLVAIYQQAFGGASLEDDRMRAAATFDNPNGLLITSSHNFASNSSSSDVRSRKS